MKYRFLLTFALFFALGNAVWAQEKVEEEEEEIQPEKRPMLIWCEDDALVILTYDYGTHEWDLRADGDYYDGHRVKYYWEYNKVTREGCETEHPEWSYANDLGNTHLISDKCKKVIIKPSFKEVHLKSLYEYFWGFDELTEIEGLEYLNTSEVTTMRWAFCRCPKLTTLDISHFDMSKVKDVNHMFAQCGNLRTIYCNATWQESQFDDSKYLFDVCFNLPHYVSTEANNHAGASLANPVTGCFTFKLDLQGKGTQDNPYTIATLDDWNTLAHFYTEAQGFPTHNFLQTADLEGVTTMVGTELVPFNGSYDGGGHKLNCAIDQPGVKYVAPFSWMSGANIENVHVTGSVRGGLHTGGLLGAMPNDAGNYIENCRVSARVQCDQAEGAPDHGGGLVGHAGSPVNLQVIGCLFDGTLATSSSVSGTVGGAIIGWCDKGDNIHLTNCVEMGTYEGFTHKAMNCYADGVFGSFGGDHCYSVNGLAGDPRAYRVTRQYDSSVSLDFLNFPERNSVTRLAFNGDGAFTFDNDRYLGANGSLKFTVSVVSSAEDYFVYRVLANDKELSEADGVYTLAEPTADVAIKVDMAKKPWTAYRSEVLRSEGNTYYIDKEADLGCLAYLVNSGAEHKDNTYVLTKDLNLEAHGWEPIGTDEHPFQGVFKGEGHTISNLGVYRPNEDYNGLFGCVRRTSSGAAIDGVHLYGATIVGRDFNGGIAGFLRQGVGVSNSTSDAKVSGHSCVGGLVGKTDPESTTWYGHADIKNCLYLGNSVTATGDYRAALIGHICETSSFENVHRIENSYFTASELKGVNSTDVYAYSIIDKTAAGKVLNYFSDLGVGYQGDYYAPAGQNVTITANTGNPLSYLYQITLNGSVQGGAVQDGAYVLENVGAGSESYELQADLRTLEIAGSGTAQSPYLIEDKYDWSDLSTLVGNGQSFEGKFLRLCNNLEIEGNTMLGAEGRPFSGIFDGQGNELEVNYNVEEAHCAPFRFTKGAVIKNLLLGGTIKTSKQFAAGLIGCSTGAETIDNVTVQTAIESSVTGDGTHGGFVARNLEGDVSFNDCIFAGSLLGANTNCVGGFVGWNDKRIRLNKCVFAPQEVTILNDQSYPSYTFVRSDDDDDTDGLGTCYYTQPLGVPGTDGYDEQGYPLVSDDANNADAVKLMADNESRFVTYNVTLKGRTIYRDGSWNTLSLPFDVTLADSPLKDAVVRTLESSSFSEGTLTLNFSEPVSKMESGKPYLVRFTTTGEDIKDPTFLGVKITDAELHDVVTPCVHFKGNYAPVGFTSGSDHVLYVGADNQLYYPNARFSINPFRAYFWLVGLSAGDVQGAIQLNFDDEGETTDLSRTSYLVPRTSNDDAWYSLDGRKLQGVPTQKGLYIHNGKKVVIK